MDMVIVAAKIHRVCRNDRGRENLSSAMKLPFDPVKCRYGRRFVDASMLGTGAERRSVLRENGRAYNQYRNSEHTTIHGNLRGKGRRRQPQVVSKNEISLLPRASIKLRTIMMPSESARSLAT